MLELFLLFWIVYACVTTYMLYASRGAEVKVYDNVPIILCIVDPKSAVLKGKSQKTFGFILFLSNEVEYNDRILERTRRMILSLWLGNFLYEYSPHYRYLMALRELHLLFVDDVDNYSIDEMEYISEDIHYKYGLLGHVPISYFKSKVFSDLGIHYIK